MLICVGGGRGIPGKLPGGQVEQRAFSRGDTVSSGIEILKKLQNYNNKQKSNFKVTQNPNLLIKRLIQKLL